MDVTHLPDLVDELLAAAREAHSGRAAHTLYGNSAHHLRQTVIALTAGHSLAEHNSPGEATLQVLRGRVALLAGDDRWDGAVGDLAAVPESRHSLLAQDDSVILLTVITGPQQP